MRIKLTLRRPEDRLTDLEVTADATASVADVANALYLADPLRSELEPPEGLTLQVQDPGAGPGAWSPSRAPPPSTPPDRSPAVRRWH